MPLRLGLLSNPRSRKNKKNPQLIGELSSILGSFGEVKECSTLESLRESIQNWRKEGIDICAINGGDGTNHQVISMFVREYGDAPLPMFYFLRGGTMNTVSNSLKLSKRSPENKLKSCVEALEKGLSPSSLSRPLLKVSHKNEDLSLSESYGFLAGVGAVHSFLAEYYKAPDPNPLIGALTLGKGALGALSGGDMLSRIAKPFTGTVEVDGVLLDAKEFLAVAMGTVNEIGLGFKPFYTAQSREDAFHALAIHGTPVQFVSKIHRVLLGKSLPEYCAKDFFPRTVTLRSAEETLPYMIDGDLRISYSPLLISLGPSLRIMRDPNETL